jgi:hypothetical protein
MMMHRCSRARGDTWAQGLKCQCAPWSLSSAHVSAPSPERHRTSGRRSAAARSVQVAGGGWSGPARRPPAGAAARRRPGAGRPPACAARHRPSRATQNLPLPCRSSSLRGSEPRAAGARRRAALRVGVELPGPAAGCWRRRLSPLPRPSAGRQHGAQQEWSGAQRCGRGAGRGGPAAGSWVLTDLESESSEGSSLLLRFVAYRLQVPCDWGMGWKLIATQSGLHQGRNHGQHAQRMCPWASGPAAQGGDWPVGQWASLAGALKQARP